MDGVIHDYEAEMSYLMCLSGLRIMNDSKLGHVLNTTYSCFAMTFMILVSIMIAISAFMVSQNIKTLEVIHWALLVCLVGCFIPIKRSMLKKEHLEIIKAGFFTYENEPPNSLRYKRYRYHVRRVRIVTKISMVFVGSVAVVTSFGRFFSNTSSLETNDKNINPLYPFPLYLPFDTTTTVGFSFGYLIQEVTICYLFLGSVGILVIFVSVIQQWVAQFEILNISITNVQERALAVYKKKKKFNDTISLGKLRYSKEFQRCVSKCLKQNVLHHHVLLRFRNSVSRFMQTIFSLLVLVPVATLAAILIVILEIEDLSEVSILMWLLGNQIGYIFILCYYGDLIKTESEKVFFSLWDTPWWNFDKSNMMTLLIMMANARKPTVLNAPGLKTNLSTQSFGDIMAGVYQFMNVMRNVK